MADGPTPLLRFLPNAKWENRHGNVRASPQRLYEVWNSWATPPVTPQRRWGAGLAAIQTIIRTAEQLNLSARALGAGWSLSDAAVTPDFMVDTPALNVLEIGFKPENCDPSLAASCDRLVFAQCGISVLELNLELEERGFSLATSGASNGQTICGAISTGTHGSANQVGSMQDFILGLHLVSEGGKHYWIEPASRPAVSQNFCDILGTQLVRDDRLFNAVRVSFGSFGIIHAVLFQAEPIYLLEKYVKRFDYAAVRDVIGTLDVGSLQLKGGNELPYHFSVVVDPYAAAADQRGAYVTWMFKRPFEQIPAPPEDVVTTVPGDDLLAVIGRISDVVPGLIPAVVANLLSSEMPTDLSGKQRATHGATFGATNLTPGGLSCELGVAIADAPRAVDAVIQIAQQHKFGGAIALRFVPPSNAFLAFTKFAPFTCTIELVMVASDRSREAYERIWDALEQQQIPHTFHWGQCMRPNFQQLQQAFGDRLQQWLGARRDFLRQQGRRTFANDLLRSWGIDT
jgi:FAD/FMN-containing dehydrogenase